MAGNAYTVYNSYALGNVTGTGESVGGLAGRTDKRTGESDGIVSSSWAGQQVIGANNVGGLVGRAGGPIYNSFAASASGQVSGTSTTVGGVGGLVGYGFSDIYGSYSTKKKRCVLLCATVRSLASPSSKKFRKK